MRFENSTSGDDWLKSALGESSAVQQHEKHGAQPAPEIVPPEPVVSAPPAPAAPPRPSKFADLGDLTAFPMPGEVGNARISQRGNSASPVAPASPVTAATPPALPRRPRAGNSTDRVIGFAITALMFALGSWCGAKWFAPKPEEIKPLVNVPDQAEQIAQHRLPSPFQPNPAPPQIRIPEKKLEIGQDPAALKSAIQDAKAALYRSQFALDNYILPAPKK